MMLALQTASSWEVQNCRRGSSINLPRIASNPMKMGVPKRLPGLNMQFEERVRNIGATTPIHRYSILPGPSTTLMRLNYGPDIYDRWKGPGSCQTLRVSSFSLSLCTKSSPKQAMRRRAIMFVYGVMKFKRIMFAEFAVLMYSLVHK